METDQEINENILTIVETLKKIFKNYGIEESKVRFSGDRERIWNANTKFNLESAHAICDEFKINKEEFDSEFSIQKELMKKRSLAEKEKQELDDLRQRVLMDLVLKKKNEVTEAITHYIEKRNHIYSIRSDNKEEVWIYSNGIYIPEGKSFIKEKCREILYECYTDAIVNNVIAKIITDTFIEEVEFFEQEDKKEIALENGILNIFTKKLTPFTPKKIFFNKIPLTYDPDKDCPFIKKHFRTVLQDENAVKLIEEIFGYLLISENKFEKAFMFVGDGRNGKSKTVELMKQFLGVENCVNIPLQQFELDPYSVGELLHMKANLAGDLDSSALKRTGVFKTTVGRDPLSAQRKFKNRIKFTNTAKHIFCANELPKTHDATIGFFSKWELVDFPFTFVDRAEYEDTTEAKRKLLKIKDPEIISKISSKSEMSGLLNLALDSLQNILKNKKFSGNQSTNDIKTKWIRKSDSLRAYLNENIVEDENGQISKKDFKNQYLLFCKLSKTKPQGDKAIKERLTTDFGAFDQRIGADGDRENSWSG